MIPNMTDAALNLIANGGKNLSSSDQADLALIQTARNELQVRHHSQ